MKCKCGHDEEDHYIGEMECAAGTTVNGEVVDCDCEDFDPDTKETNERH
jgi:hypothetical protein